MTRRVAAGFGRLLPLLLIGAAAVIVVGAALMGGCGNPSPSPTETVTVTATPSGTAQATASPSQAPSASPTATATETVVRLYFLRGEKLGVAERRVPQTTGVAKASMKALLAGPSSSEQAAGLTTTIPKGTRLLGLTIGDGEATVDLSSRFGSGGGSASMQARVAEVVYTLTRFSTVRSVRFLMEGQPVEALGGEGLVLTEPQRRADWRGLEPTIFVESPGVGAVLANPFALGGTASVFEGSFQARLQDASGRRVVLVTVQASQGAPGRGRFSRIVPYSTSATSGTLIVFDRSMEDGSIQNEVRIPVKFASP